MAYHTENTEDGESDAMADSDDLYERSDSEYYGDYSDDCQCSECRASRAWLSPNRIDQRIDFVATPRPFRKYGNGPFFFPLGPVTVSSTSAPTTGALGKACTIRIACRKR